MVIWAVNSVALGVAAFAVVGERALVHLRCSPWTCPVAGEYHWAAGVNDHPSC